MELVLNEADLVKDGHASELDHWWRPTHEHQRFSARAVLVGGCGGAWLVRGGERVIDCGLSGASSFIFYIQFYMKFQLTKESQTVYF